MKKLLIILLALLLAACADAPEAEETPAAGPQYPKFTYTHYASGGTAEEYEAVILFEQSNSTFTAYQVAFSSCTCRDSMANHLSVCYVELLNTKDTAEEASIRYITFGENKGLWGDSNPNYYRHDYTEEYYDENFVQRLVRASKADLDAWEGYGTQIESVEPDLVTGATVSTGNITSMLQGLFEYHAGHYYAAEGGE